MNLLVGLLLSASANGQLPEFAFKFFRGSGVYNEQALRDADCVESGARFDCSLRSTVAGRWALIQYTVVDQRLTRMRVSGLRQAIPDVLPQLRGKYGEPCESSLETVTNRRGGQFRSQTYTWCFATGNLIFRERDDRADSYSLTYSAFDQPPSAQRKPTDF